MERSRGVHTDRPSNHKKTLTCSVVLTADTLLQTADMPTSARGRPGERLDTIRPCDPDAAALAIRHALLTAATMCDRRWPTWRPSRSVVRRSSELSMARRRTGPTLVTRDHHVCRRVQERGTGAVLRRCMVPLDCPCARGCVGTASRVPAANLRQFVTRIASEACTRWKLSLIHI